MLNLKSNTLKKDNLFLKEKVSGKVWKFKKKYLFKGINNDVIFNTQEVYFITPKIF